MLMPMNLLLETRVVVSYVHGNIRYARQQLSPSARFQWVHQGLRASPKMVVHWS